MDDDNDRSKNDDDGVEEDGEVEEISESGDDL